LHRVVDVIDADRDIDVKLRGEIAGNLPALFERFGILNQQLIPLVGLGLIRSDRMAFADVNDEELSFVFVDGIGLLDLTDRAAERRSGATAEIENDRFPLTLGKRRWVFAFDIAERKARRGIANFQIAVFGAQIRFLLHGLVGLFLLRFVGRGQGREAECNNERQQPIGKSHVSYPQARMSRS
jgi:hypothetical protein